jgi:hypothetical protein
VAVLREEVVKLKPAFLLGVGTPTKMTTPTSYIARDISTVVQCVERLFDVSQAVRQAHASRILESYGSYYPSSEGYQLFAELTREDRCLVARHVQEGDSTNHGFSDDCRIPAVFQLHLVAVKAEWLRIQDGEAEPLCEFCGCDPNLEDHLEDCESLECNQDCDE